MHALDDFLLFSISAELNANFLLFGLIIEAALSLDLSS
jgi:hypothetical protein